MTTFVERLAARAIGLPGGFSPIARSRFDSDPVDVVEVDHDVEPPVVRRAMSVPVAASLPERRPAPTRFADEEPRAATTSHPATGGHVPAPNSRPAQDAPAQSTPPRTSPAPSPEPERPAVAVRAGTEQLVIREELRVGTVVEQGAERDRPARPPYEAKPTRPPRPRPDTVPADWAGTPREEAAAPLVVQIRQPAEPTGVLAPLPEPPSTVIEVSIGRIEVTARPFPAPRPSPSPTPRPSTVPALEDYLAERSRR